MTSDTNWDMTSSLVLPLQEPKQGATAFPDAPPLALLPHEVSLWEDTPSSMTDSLLSLDFESNELGSSLLSSSSLSEPSPPMVTPTDVSGAAFFSPLHQPMFASPAEEAYEPQPKRQRTHARSSAWGVTGAMSDFTLFPKDEEENAQRTSIQPTLVKHAESANVLQLLESLNAAPAYGRPGSASLFAPSLSPRLLYEKGAGALSQSTPALPPPPTEVNRSRNTRRRIRNADELLPMDAPVQQRTYHTESATSRRDSHGSGKSSGSASPTDTQNSPATPKLALENGQEQDPRLLKRLSNTLAARRSRHRKAEELNALHDTIRALQTEVSMWKKQCEAAEKERDLALIARAPR